MKKKNTSTDSLKISNEHRNLWVTGWKIMVQSLIIGQNHLSQIGRCLEDGSE